MKKPYKRPFMVFSVLALIMFVAFAALLAFYPFMFVKGDFRFIPTFLGAVYFNLDTLKGFIDFSVGIIPKIITLVVVGFFALLSLILILLSLIKLHKKPLSMFVGFLLGLLSLALAYFGGLVAVANVWTTAPIYNATTGFTGAVAEWTGWIGVIDIIKGGLNGLPSILRLVFQIGMILVMLLYLLLAYTAVINGGKYVRAAKRVDKEVVTEEVPETVEEPELAEEPIEAVPEEMPVFMPEPEDETVDPANLSTTALAAIIKDVVREIVRDELERNNLLGKDGGAAPVADSHTDNRSIVGATFGGPLIVQYFNGGIQSAGQAPAAAPAEEPKEEPKEEPAPAPVEEPKEEPAPAPVEEPAPAPVVEEAPVPAEEAPAPVVEEPAPAPVVEKQPKAPIVRIPFEERLLASDKDIQDLYSVLKNEILSWGVKSRVSSSGDTFRLHRKTYIKMTVAGKSLKLYFALNPDDYRDSPIPVQDASEKGIYAEIPLVFKVKSPLSVRRCKQLIQDVMEKDGLEQGEIGTVNWIKELKAELKARKSEKK